MDANEQRARAFHEVYERLAPQFGYETRQETREFDPTSANGRLMIATMQALAQQVPADGEVVAWQHRIIMSSHGSWSGWAQSTSAEEAAETVRRYEASGIKAEWRALYAATPQAPQPTTEYADGVDEGKKQAKESLLNDVETMQFLTDVLTAAGLLYHGKTDKCLAQRISDGQTKLREKLHAL